MKLFNTLGRKKQEFRPLKKGQVSMYTCGPTVYQYAHIGNLRAYLAEDILRRTLEYNGYKVKQVMNITDVGHLTSDADTGEDKVEREAKKEHKTAKEITKFYAEQFMKDLKALNIEMPVKFAWASKYIKEQIALIKKLEKKGYTYKTTDGIYFDTAKFKGYGKLAPLRQGFGGSSSRARVAHSKEKKRQTDFALWKFSGTEKRQQEWKSPWGVGYPGWHIECSAISTKELGQPFDIHTGGEDHIATHHNNEIAQSEAAYNKPLAKYWFHNAFMVIDPLSFIGWVSNKMVCSKGHETSISKRKLVRKRLPDGTLVYCGKCGVCGEEMGMIKMSKSKGNVINLADLVKNEVDPIAFRYLAIGSHYRSNLVFSLQALEGASNSLNKLRAVFSISSSSSPTRSGIQTGKTKMDSRPAVQQENGKGKVDATYKKRFGSALNDDLNMSKAMAVVWELVKSKKSLADKQTTLLDFDRVLGLGLKDDKPLTIPVEVKKLVAEREKARQAKNWKKADQLRTQISRLGFAVEDTSSGPKMSRN
ncbi:MAG: cysteine--tRNA ligase [Patescibacteria group bacterium]